MNWCNQYGISPYNTVNRNVGDTITLTATGTGGIAPYTATFTSTNTSGGITSTGLSTATYLVVALDAGKTLTFNATVRDSCSTPMTSPSVSSTAIISTQCGTPTCNFTVV